MSIVEKVKERQPVPMLRFEMGDNLHADHPNKIPGKLWNKMDDVEDFDVEFGWSLWDDGIYPAKKLHSGF